ncbi:unnamed protein product [Prorocentrum cordatum]|nr:unnamed protein product [Polarella glacialis]
MLDDAALSCLLGRVAPTLEVLDTSSASEKLCGRSLEEFASAMPVLSQLRMVDNFQLSSSAIEAVAQGCSDTLKLVNLNGCRKLGNEAVASLAACRHLEHLGLRGLWKLETGPLTCVLEACSQLQSLDLTFCSRVWGPDVFRAAAGHSQELSELLVSGVGGVDDEAVLSLALSTAGAAMRHLAIGRCDITAQALKAIRRNCPRLRRLDISDCHEVAESSVMDLVMEMPSLRVLQTKHCRLLSVQMQLYLAQLLAGRSLGYEEQPAGGKATAVGAAGSLAARPGAEPADCGAASSSSSHGAAAGASAGAAPSSSSCSPTVPSSSSTTLPSGSSSSAPSPRGGGSTGTGAEAESEPAAQGADEGEGRPEQEAPRAEAAAPAAPSGAARPGPATPRVVPGHREASTSGPW